MQKKNHFVRKYILTLLASVTADARSTYLGFPLPLVAAMVLRTVNQGFIIHTTNLHGTDFIFIFVFLILNAVHKNISVITIFIIPFVLCTIL